MDTVATLSADERAELFQETANRRGVAIQIIEKDFWVCWTLKQLFELPDIGQELIFKGGTSLSKIFQAIERFSEDIDVSINREYLGFKGTDDPENIEGTNKRKKGIEALQQACIDKIGSTILPLLGESFARVLGDRGKGQEVLFWQLTQDTTDLQTLLFAYPQGKSSQDRRDLDYIKPLVRIELGARSDHWPAEKYSITPYAAEEFPDYFKEPKYTLKVLEAERTFWEKATLLHAEYYRPEDSTTAERIFRHYYDLHRLDEIGLAEKALDKLELLDRVVEHKKIFFTSARAKYDEANTGSIHLLPYEVRLAALKIDYEKTKDMFFGEIPPFDKILKTISKLEAQINSRVSDKINSKK